MTASVVHLERVTRIFDGVPAVSQINLQVAAGEAVWVCGTNGSGKSTLLRVVGTALSPTFGSGRVLGYDLVRERNEIRAHVEMLGHQSRLYVDLSAVENLRFVCRMYGVDPGRVKPALERVGLDEVGHVRVASFSQGMRQRLALARCLMRDPALILLDEPYAGLDVEARMLVDGLLAQARARSRTVLIASHEEPAAGLIDRQVLLEAGRIRAEKAVVL